MPKLKKMTGPALRDEDESESIESEGEFDEPERQRPRLSSDAESSELQKRGKICFSRS